MSDSHIRRQSMLTLDRLLLAFMAALSLWFVDASVSVPVVHADSGWLIEQEGGTDWLMVDAQATIGWNVEYARATSAVIYPDFDTYGPTTSSYVQVAGNAKNPNGDIRYRYDIKWADTGEAAASFGNWSLDNGESYTPSENICHLDRDCVDSMKTRGLIVEAKLFGQGSPDTYGGIGELVVKCIGCSGGANTYRHFGLGVWDVAPIFQGGSLHYSEVNSLQSKVARSEDPVNTISGNFEHANTDLAIPGKGVPLQFTRFYNSGWTDSRALGYGWTHTYDHYLTFDGDDVSVFYPDGHAVLFLESAGTYTPRDGVFDALVKNGDDTYTLTTPGAIQYHFSAAGKLTSIVDRNGNTTSLAYTGNDLSTVTDAGGRSLTFTSAGGRITEITDPLDRTVEYDYDGNGDLTEVTNVKGGSSTFAYSSHKMTSMTDANGNDPVTNIYDGDGRVAEQTDALGGITCIYYGTGATYTSTECPGVTPAPSITETVIVDQRSLKTTYQHDLYFRTVGVSDDDGNKTTFAYDSDNNRTCVTDPLGQRTAFTYDAQGNATGVIDAENTDINCQLKAGGVKSTYVYTALNDIDFETDPLGNERDYVYDSAGNLTMLIEQRNASGVPSQRTCFEYDEDGLVTAIVQATDLSYCSGNRTVFEYDQYGNQTAVVDPRFTGPSVTPKGAVKVGTFVRATTTGLQTIQHDLGAKPAALLLWTASTTDESFRDSIHLTIGMSDGTTSRSVSGASRCCAYSTSRSHRRQSDAVFTLIYTDGAVAAEAELGWFDAEQFTLDWTNSDSGTAHLIGYMVIGGSEVATKVSGWNTAGSTGSQSVSGIGFEPEAVVHLWTNLPSTTVPDTGTHALLGLGAMDASGNEWSNFWSTIHNAGTSNTQRGQRLDSAIYNTNASGSQTQRASFESMDADGFTVDWETSSAIHVASLAVAGLDVDVGSFSKTSNSAPASQAVTGVGFEPAAALLTGIQVSSTNYADHGRWSFGAADSAAESALAVQDPDAAGSPNPEGIQKFSKVYLKVDNNSKVIDAEADLTSLDSDGFTLNWTTNDTNATDILYFAVGGEAGSANEPLDPPKTTMTYDLGGRRLTVTNELDHTTTFTYDNQNNLLTVTDNLSNVTTNTYDAKGNLLTITDDNANVTTYAYDDYDRLVSVTDDLGGVTTYGYDELGNRTAVTNANREAVSVAETGADCGTAGTGDGVDDDSDTAADDGCPSVIYTYDNLNRLASQVDAVGNTWSYEYDEAGRLVSRTDPEAQETLYTYNLRNQLTGIDYPMGTTDVSFDYDDARRRTEMVDDTGTTTYAYDALNRLTSVTFPGSRVVAYSYDEVGNRETITYPTTDEVTYAYDKANRLVMVSDWDVNVTVYDYDDAGRLESALLANGVEGLYEYDNAGRLTGISWEKDSNVLAHVDYTLDGAGNRTQRVDGLGTHTYAYDDLYRLTDVTYPGPDDVDYTYDAVGNRKTLVTSAGTTQYVYDAADRLTSVTPPGQSAISYTWDDNGNLTDRGADNFVWDAEDRLTSATVGAATTTFAYSGDGLRDSLTFDGSTTTFTWDVNRPIPQVVDDETYQYVYGLGRIAQVGSAATFYYLTDGLGSTMALTDDAGDVDTTWDYYVFGAVRSTSGSQPNDFTFAGEQVDGSTDLQYLRARYYDPEVGRFMSRDPIAGISGMPGSQNRYPYVLNNPANLLDPSGLCAFGAPCPKPLKKAGEAAGNALEYAYGEGRKHTVIALDSTALGANVVAAAVTDTAALIGCGIGILNETPLAGCAVGYGVGLVITAPVRLVADLASGAGSVLTCAGPQPKESLSAFLENCAASAAAAIIGAVVPDPNLGVLLDSYILCRDLQAEGVDVSC